MTTVPGGMLGLTWKYRKGQIKKWFKALKTQQKQIPGMSLHRTLHSTNTTLRTKIL